MGKALQAADDPIYQVFHTTNRFGIDGAHSGGRSAAEAESGGRGPVRPSRAPSLRHGQHRAARVLCNEHFDPSSIDLHSNMAADEPLLGGVARDGTNSTRGESPFSTRTKTGAVTEERQRARRRIPVGKTHDAAPAWQPPAPARPRVISWREVRVSGTMCSHKSAVTDDPPQAPRRACGRRRPRAVFPGFHYETA